MVGCFTISIHVNNWLELRVPGAEVATWTKNMTKYRPLRRCMAFTSGLEFGFAFLLPWRIPCSIPPNWLLGTSEMGHFFAQIFELHWAWSKWSIFPRDVPNYQYVDGNMYVHIEYITYTHKYIYIYLRTLKIYHHRGTGMYGLFLCALYVRVNCSDLHIHRFM